MGVDAAEAHRADAGAQWAIRRPALGLSQWPQRWRGAAELRMRLLHTSGWRQNLRVDRHHGLEQTGDSGRGFGVADVGFDGADDGWGRIGFGLPPGARERFQF